LFFLNLSTSSQKLKGFRKIKKMKERKLRNLKNTKKILTMMFLKKSLISKNKIDIEIKK
jgi:hypothetical protein